MSPNGWIRMEAAVCDAQHHPKGEAKGGKSCGNSVMFGGARNAYFFPFPAIECNSYCPVQRLMTLVVRQPASMLTDFRANDVERIKEKGEIGLMRSHFRWSIMRKSRKPPISQTCRYCSIHQRWILLRLACLELTGCALPNQSVGWFGNWRILKLAHKRRKSADVAIKERRGFDANAS